MNQPPDAAPRRLTLVLGMHRSGTSLCSHTLSLLGLDMADTATPTESNARGHWERWEIVELHDRVFRLFGQDYYDPRHAMPLPTGWWADPKVRQIRNEITAWMSGRMAGSRRFGLKDPRLSRLLPMWREILADLAVEARFIVCLRHPDAVAQSLRSRDALELAEGHLRWLTYTAELVDELGETPLTILPYERWFGAFDSNFSALSRLAPYPGAAVPGVRAAIAATVDATLRHHDFAADAGCGAAATLYRLLLADVERGAFSRESRMFASAVSEMSRLVQPAREELLRRRGDEAELAATRRELERLTKALQAAEAAAADRRVAANGGSRRSGGAIASDGSARGETQGQARIPSGTTSRRQRKSTAA